MRPLAQCRTAAAARARSPRALRGPFRPARTGAVMILEESGRLPGIFTDSDLARLFERAVADAAIDGPISMVMTRQPMTAENGPCGASHADLRSWRPGGSAELPVLDAGIVAAWSACSTSSIWSA